MWIAVYMEQTLLDNSATQWRLDIDTDLDKDTTRDFKM